jgi:hypothetical protein
MTPTQATGADPEVRPAEAPTAAPDATPTPVGDPSRGARAASTPGLTYAEEGDGEHVVWADVAGFAWWATDRAPLSDQASVVFGVGYGHRIGPARLAWRVHAHLDPVSDRPLTFLYLDFLSVERVYDLRAWRPFWRVGFGLGLDLVGDGRRSFGENAFFNEENGASGGVGLTAGGGADWFASEAWFLRAAVDGRGYIGAGRSGAMATGLLGMGWVF